MGNKTKLQVASNLRGQDSCSDKLDGAWAQAAARIAQAEHMTSFTIMPPSFCGRNEAASSEKVADM